MGYKVIALILITVIFIYNTAGKIFMFNSVSRLIPENVKDVYDLTTYQKWSEYTVEKTEIKIYKELVNYVILFLLLIFDVFSIVAKIASPNIYGQAIVILVFFVLVNLVGDIVFDYIDTMKIESKYGFNKTSKKTFIMDQIKNLILSLVLIIGLVSAFIGLYVWLGDWILLVFSLLIFLFILAIFFLAPLFAKIFNKFTPLEEGVLRTNLENLLTKNGYKVNEIKVMDGSRRSSKANAYFSGLGKTKNIVLYDTILELMSEEEIVAVFAHELGHGKNRDVLKGYLQSLFQVFIFIVIIWFIISRVAFVKDFGFATINYGFAFIVIATVILPLVNIVMAPLTTLISRKHEYKADRFALESGYGEALVSGLKKLSRSNYATLNPHPFIVITQYTHPPLSQRIAALERKI
ncbi:MAG TPA: M48 family metallopeptidase [Bacilli bacterium]|nr:M48 family metallopeptidase [Bacilli bacterium]